MSCQSAPVPNYIPGPRAVPKFPNGQSAPALCYNAHPAARCIGVPF
ncbi:unnamed protein product, partial [Staurois parvus]